MRSRITPLVICSALMIVLVPKESSGACHDWKVKEVFSNQAGDIQYIELFAPTLNGEVFTSNSTLSANSGGVIRNFPLARNLTGPTLNRHLLFATPGFASLPGAVTPDFTLPCGPFFNPTATSITISYSCPPDSITFAGMILPKDGINSLTDQNLLPLGQDLQPSVSSPTNQANAAGSLSLSACLNDGTCGLCDDGLFCNGAETCVGTACTTGPSPCPFACDEAGDVCLGCGNNTIDIDEVCDGTALGGQRCDTQGFDDGTLACALDCLSFDTSGCNRCGDANAAGTEACDGTDLRNQECTNFDFDGGTLACNLDCTFDTSACTDCGDGVVEGTEQCDGTDLDGRVCTDFFFDGGDLSCSAECLYELGQCTTNQICGDGDAAGPEQCDGADFNDATCLTQSFDGGTLACLPPGHGSQCRYDTSGCCRCGDDAICGTEVCDGTSLDGATCISEGFDDGTIACDGSCQLDTTGCTFAAVCGNGMQETGEQCDDNNTTSGDGCSATCTTETTGGADPGEDSGCRCAGAEVPLSMLAALALVSGARRRQRGRCISGEPLPESRHGCGYRSTSGKASPISPTLSPRALWSPGAS